MPDRSAAFSPPDPDIPPRPLVVQWIANMDDEEDTADVDAGVWHLTYHGTHPDVNQAWREAITAVQLAPSVWREAHATGADYTYGDIMASPAALTVLRQRGFTVVDRDTEPATVTVMFDQVLIHTDD